MANIRSNRRRAMTMPAGLCLGASISIVTTLAGTVLLGNLIQTEVLRWENIGYGILIVIILSSFTGTLAANWKIKRNTLLVCISTGGIYLCILLSLTALFFGGQYEAVGVTSGLVLGGSGAASILCLQRSRGGEGRNKRRYYC